MENMDKKQKNKAGKKILTFGAESKDKAEGNGGDQGGEVLELIEQINKNAHHTLSLDEYIEMYKKLEKFLLQQLKKSDLS